MAAGMSSPLSIRIGASFPTFIEIIQCTRISVSPFDLALNLQAMTIEKLQFSLPAIFTIGPDNEPKALRKYALLLSGDPDGNHASKLRDAAETVQKSHVQEIVRAVIEGETRAIVSTMTMEEIFKERHIFKTKGVYL